jgi:plasmid maintenance system antidote protein VapI
VLCPGELGLGADEAARHIARTDSTLSRMETGQTVVSARVLERLLELYGATPEECENMTELARQARQRDWWQRYADILHPGFELYVGLEAEASYGSEWVPACSRPRHMPGPFSTPNPDRAPTRRSRGGWRRASPVSRSCPATNRYSCGRCPTKLFSAEREAVLRRTVGGPEVMREQLLALVKKSRMRNVKIQILPFPRGAHPAMFGAFTLLSIDLRHEPIFAGVRPPMSRTAVRARA